MAKKTTAPTVTLDLTPEEAEAIQQLRAGTKSAETSSEASVGTKQLADALVQAIQATKPVEKKNPFNRKVNTPWTPKDGSKKLKLKRKVYHHGLLLDEDILSNAEIEGLNKVRPGRYCDNFVTVYRRKDRGIDIDYPVKTPSQKLRLINQFGIRNLAELCQYLIAEAERPKRDDSMPDED